MKEIEQLLDITSRLKKKYEGTLDFPLDGRLVGDIGEALVSEKFDIKLYSGNTPVYDGEHRITGKKVQIKASMSYNFNYPFNKDLEHYMAVHIERTGKIVEIYNGPGKPIHDFLKSRNRKTYRDIWYTITAPHLRDINNQIDDKDRLIPKKI